MFKKKRNIWIFIAALVIIAGGAYYYFTTTKTTATEASDEPPLQTAIARRGDLTVFASAAGQVIPASEIDIGFDESGTLIELPVQVGDRVQAEQVLARLQTNNTEEEIALSITDAELNVLTKQQALDDIYASADVDAAQALLAVESAEQALDDLNNQELNQAEALQAIAEAEEDVADAERAYYNARSTASQSVIDAAYAELVLAAENLKKAEDKFAPYTNRSDENLEKANLQLQLSSAQGVYDSALRTYNAASGTASDLDKALTEAALTTAQAKLEAVQREWEAIKDGGTLGERALAEAQLTAARAEWEVLQDGPDPDEIALAEANLANAQAKLAEAMEQQAVIELVAPFDGTILSIDATVGESVGTSAIITLADLSQPNLEVFLDETDLDKVGIGYEIDVIFDALPNDTFTGAIIEIDPSLQTVSGVQAIRVLAQLDPESFSKPLSLPVGLNASVDVIGGRSENAVLVPVEALRELGPDEYAVFVVADGEPRLRVVTVGLIDFTSAEIVSGLEAGETVTTGIVQTQQ